MGKAARGGSDRLLKALVKEGINIVLPPREGIRAGDLVLVDKQGAARTADWKIALGVDPSVINRPEPTFDGLSFTVSDALNVKANGSLVGRILSKLGVGAGKLDAAMDKTGAASLSVGLVAPAVSALKNLDEILEALREARALPRPGYQDFRFLAVQRVYRARGLALELANASGANVAMTVQAAEELAMGAGVQVMDRGDGRITFVAPKPLIFGVTLRELHITLEGVTDTAQTAHFSFRGAGDGEEAGDGYAMISDDLFVDLPLDDTPAV